VPFDPTPTFLVELGLRRRPGGDGALAEAAAAPSLCWPGTGLIRTSVLATYADIVCGELAHQLSGDRVPLTLDLTVRRLRLAAVPSLLLEGRIVKAGSTVVQTEAWVQDPDGGPALAVVHLGFMASPRPQDIDVDIQAMRAAPPRPVMTTPLPERVGCRVVEPGVVELDLAPYVSNPTGTIQGGMVALLGELAAESARPGQIAIELDVRYLSATRVGPARATGRVLTGGDDESVVRVEIRDVGNQDRLTALIMVRTAAVPTGP
jgi:acyl-coenzyme A thioesterase PaaI-like protein